MSDTFTLLGGQLTLVDAPPRPTEDALWLAASIHPPKDVCILDAGCGCGAVGLVLAHRHPTAQITGLDIHAPTLEQASKNIALNNFTSRFTCCEGDFTRNDLPQKHFHHVIANLPFHAQLRGHETFCETRAKAHSLPPHMLQEWLPALWRHTHPEGQLSVLVHSAEEQDIRHFATTHKLHIQCCFLQSHAERPPKRLIAHYATTPLPPDVTIPTFNLTYRKLVLNDGQPLP